MIKPIISIIIPTYCASINILEVALKSIANQTCSKSFYEVIIADNNGGQDLRRLVKKYGALVIEVKGKPPQTCNQVNLGAKNSKGDYIFILDHDIELSPNLIENFVKLSSTKRDVDAWYIPYKIVARGKLLTSIRNFEEDFYRDSVVAAARIIKKNIFWQTERQYDSLLNAGPGDWDLSNQLRLINAKFDYIGDYVYHHEENLDFFKFTTKKTIYIRGGEVYKEKWKKKNLKIYSDIVKKQYDPFYRLFWVFVEKGKWRKLLPKMPLYFLFLLIKISMAISYLYSMRSLSFSKNPKF